MTMSFFINKDSNNLQHKRSFSGDNNDGGGGGRLFITITHASAAQTREQSWRNIVRCISEIILDAEEYRRL